MKKIITLALACVSVSSALSADITTAFGKCATTDNDKQRLACYDKLRDEIVKANTPAAKGGGDRFELIQIADMKVDAKQLVGKRLSVVAAAQTMGDMTMLKSDPADMAPLWADVEKLPREDRKKLVNGCQMVLCTGQFYGVMRNSPIGPKFHLESVAWR